MKIRFKKALLTFLSCALLLAAISALILWYPLNTARREVEQTRQALRQEGFKTDLAEFDFSTSIEHQSREAAVLNATDGPVVRRQNFSQPDLMPAASGDCAIVIWKHERPDLTSEEVMWAEFSAMVRGNQTAEDAAADALITGPIRFQLTPNRGLGMLLRHLPPVRSLSQALANRTVVELHEGDMAAAWTNLLAQTRLVTAWEPEPVDVSHLVRFACLTFAFNTTWQALQTNAWTDAQLAQLQKEWESVNLFNGLPETIAFRRAGAVATCEQSRREPFDWNLAAAFREMLRSPREGWLILSSSWQHRRYLQVGSYRDENALMLHYREREIELRNALRSSDWAQMQSLPGATNAPRFTSSYRASTISVVLNLRELGTGMYRGGTSLLGRAAEAETRRRLIVTALALERFQRRHKVYPATLDALAPEFLNPFPTDFMNGKPLRYRIEANRGFVLYSVGQDGVDNNGQMRHWERHERFEREGMPVDLRSTSGFDLVWPRAATAEDLKAYEEALIAEATGEFIAQSERASEYYWQATARRQANAAQLLAASTRTNAAARLPDGRPINEVLSGASSNASLNLDELLTLQPVTTGEEPEIITFELPIRFASLTNMGNLTLLVDNDAGGDSDDANLALLVTCESAPNGNCRLIWNTIFEAPGLHAVQAMVVFNESLRADPVAGPVTAMACGNLCQFGAASLSFDTTHGAPLHMRFPERLASYSLQILSTNRELLRTFSGTTSNGVVKLHWNLTDEQGQRWDGDFFSSVLRVTLPASGQFRTMKGP